jgi:hypothetical protein
VYPLAESKATPVGVSPTRIFFTIESAQALSKPKEALNNNATVTTTKVRINVQETMCFFINQPSFDAIQIKSEIYPTSISYKMTD